VMSENVSKAKKILELVIPRLRDEPPHEKCSCCRSHETALI